MNIRPLFIMVSLVPLAGEIAFAADLDLGSDSAAVGATASVPAVLTNAADLSLVTFEVQPDPALGAPTAVAGADQANLLPDDVFVDDLGAGTYRVTAFVRSIPNFGNGTIIDLQFDLTGIGTGTYPVAITSAELLSITNGNVTGALSGGSVTITSGINTEEWMLLDE